MPVLRRTCTALLATALAASLGVVAAGPASADPPTVVDDHVSMYVGAQRLVDVLANDSDSDGDQLAVCRLGDSGGAHRYYYADIADTRLVVAVFPGASGDITITYYACDFDTLVPATLTISVKQLRPVRVRKLDRPGRVRVVNRNVDPVRFLYGDFDARRPDGRVVVPARGAVVVRVHRHAIDWIALIGRSVLADIGTVHRIDLPRGAGSARRAAVQLTPRETRAWAARR